MKYILELVFLLSYLVNFTLQDCLFADCECQTASDIDDEDELINISCDGNNEIFFDNTEFPFRNNDTVFDFRIKTLQIINFNISSINDNVFSGLSIETLELRRNNLESLPKDVFKGIKGLETLDLSDNYLEDVSTDLFKNLKDLRVLSLARNSLSQLESDLFINFNKLKSLDLSGNSLTSLDKSLLKPLENTLESLYISANKFETLPLMGDFKEMNYVDASYNRLKYIDHLALSASITGFVLSNNQIESIFKYTFENAPNLILLDLSSNVITDIDKTAFEGLSQLHILRLSYNKLKEIPNIYMLSNLAELDVSNQYPSNFIKIQNYALDKNYDGISINSTPNLVRLDLTNNKIEEIESKAFCSHNNRYYQIEYLILNKNPIKKLDPCFFEQLKTSNRLTIFFYSNSSSSTSPELNNCDCDVVNYLSGKDINLLSDCDLSESTKCSRMAPINNSTFCSDNKSDYECNFILNMSDIIRSSYVLILFNIFVLIYFY